MNVDTEHLDALLEWIGNHIGSSNLYINQDRYDKIIAEVNSLKSEALSNA